MDEPLCDLGLPCLLRVFLVLLGRSHLASISSSFHGAFLGECPTLALRGRGCSIPSVGLSRDLRMAGCVQPCSFLYRRGSLKADNALVAIQVLGFGKRWFAFLPAGSFLVLRPLSSLQGSGVNMSGSVCACGWGRKEKLRKKRNPVIWKERKDEADAEQEDPALWGGLRGRNKPEKVQILLLEILDLSRRRNSHWFECDPDFRLNVLQKQASNSMLQILLVFYAMWSRHS